MPQDKCYAPRDVFEKILKWMVIPTFDLILEINGKGVLLLKRKIAPYKNKWALPGLRIYKGESIDETLIRIVKNEISIRIDPSKKIFLGQYVGKFRSEEQRQDLSTGYLIAVDTNDKIKINKEHFSTFKFISKQKKIPRETGAMYRYYLGEYFKRSK
ncbi:NUDIX domain-containing protein [Candidatus Dojkabacteria bacterium]|nr:NUDIX domain-containing protein [Candidatus Dojkabacteria bacterium]